MESRFNTMVSASGRGKIVAMERLLSSNNLLDPLSEMNSRDKFAPQYIQKELNEADESNFLDEEDMHVFERRPLHDPLHLVACNTCRKPIKASQYAGHSERCRRLNSSEDSGLVLDSGAGPKKPNRKARKLIQTVQDSGNGRDKELLDTLDADDSAASESADFDECQKRVSSSAKELKITEVSAGMDECTTLDDSRTGTGCGNISEVPLSPTQRTKLMSSQSSVTTEELEICGARTNSGTFEETVTCKLNSDSSDQLLKEQTQLCDGTLEEGLSRETELNTSIKQKRKRDLSDVPFPLVTKIYYPRQNQNLRVLIGHLFNESLSRENIHGHNISKSFPAETAVQPVTSHGQLPEFNMSDLHTESSCQKKNEAFVLPSTGISEQMLLATSEICHSISGRQHYPKYSQQFHDSRLLSPQFSIDPGTAGTMRNRLLQAQYTFPVTAGSPVSTMQQTTGVVPVI